MPMPPEPSSIVWAVEPFSTIGEDEATEVATLSRMLGIGTRVEPIYVLRESPVDPAITASEASAEQLGREALERELAKVAVPGLRAPRVLLSASPGIADMVGVLVDAAVAGHASLIFARTHARTGLERWLEGSFTERLLHDSPVPVWVHGDGVPKRQVFRKVLFPTDLSETSRAAFEAFLPTFARLGVEVLLTHWKGPDVSAIYHVPDFPLVPTPPVPMDVLRQSAESPAQAWVEHAEQLGVPVRFRAIEGKETLDAGILRVAREERVDLIAMASETGPVAAALIGSTTREVVRSAPCPVLVLSPRARERHFSRAA
jgi:nucleotide-binding universal stress UspA family protein